MALVMNDDQGVIIIIQYPDGGGSGRYGFTECYCQTFGIPRPGGSTVLCSC